MSPDSPEEIIIKEILNYFSKESTGITLMFNWIKDSLEQQGESWQRQSNKGALGLPGIRGIKMESY